MIAQWLVSTAWLSLLLIHLSVVFSCPFPIVRPSLMFTPLLFFVQPGRVAVLGLLRVKHLLGINDANWPV